jgi:hypothetical protein
MEVGTSRRSETSEAGTMEPAMESGVEPENGTKGNLGPGVQIDEGRIQAHLNEVVRSTVEETLNALLDAGAVHFYVAPGSMSAAKAARIRGRVATIGGCRPRRAK